jgi:hypothetical protein
MENAGPVTHMESMVSDLIVSATPSVEKMVQEPVVEVGEMKSISSSRRLLPLLFHTDLSLGNLESDASRMLEVEI